MVSCLDRWLGRLNPNTAKRSWYMFRAFMGYLGRNGGVLRKFGPDELVEYQKKAIGEDRYSILDLLQVYLTERDGRASYKTRIYGCVRSFFLHNRAELPRDRSFKIRSEIPPVVGSLDLDTFKHILLKCNKMYRAIFLAMFQGGMGVEEVLYWSRNGFDSVREQFFKDSNPLRIDLPGRKFYKNIRPYHTYIGRDAIKALRQWVETRPIVEHPDIFITQFKTPVKYKSIYQYWMWQLRRLGIIGKKGPNKGNRYGKNPHEIRDMFRTRWQKSGRAPEVAEFLMGHQIDPLRYNKAMQDLSYTCREYRRAEKWLNILSQDPEHIHIDDVEESITKEISDLRRIVLEQGEFIQKLMERVKP